MKGYARFSASCAATLLIILTVLTVTPTSADFRPGQNVPVTSMIFTIEPEGYLRFSFVKLVGTEWLPVAGTGIGDLESVSIMSMSSLIDKSDHLLVTISVRLREPVATFEQREKVINIIKYLESALNVSPLSPTSSLEFSEKDKSFVYMGLAKKRELVDRFLQLLTKKYVLNLPISPERIAEFRRLITLVSIERDNAGNLLGYATISGYIEEIRLQGSVHDIDLIGSLGVKGFIAPRDERLTITVVLPSGTQSSKFEASPDVRIHRITEQVYSVVLEPGELLQRLKFTFRYDISTSDPVLGTLDSLSRLRGEFEPHANGQVSEAEGMSFRDAETDGVRSAGIGLVERGLQWLSVHFSLPSVGLMVCLLALACLFPGKKRVAIPATVILSVLLVLSPTMPVLAESVSEKPEPFELFFRPKQYVPSGKASDLNIPIIIPTYYKTSEPIKRTFIDITEAHIIATPAIVKPGRYDKINQQWKQLFAVLGYDWRFITLIEWFVESLKRATEKDALFVIEEFLAKMAEDAGSTSVFLPGEKAGVNNWIVFFAKPTDFVKEIYDSIKSIIEIGKNLITHSKDVLLIPVLGIPLAIFITVVGMLLIVGMLIVAFLLAIVFSKLKVTVSAAFPREVGDRVVTVAHYNGVPVRGEDTDVWLKGEWEGHSLPIFMGLVMYTLNIIQEKDWEDWISKVPHFIYIPVPGQKVTVKILDLEILDGITGNYSEWDRSSGWFIAEYLYLYYEDDKKIKVEVQFHDAMDILEQKFSNYYDKFRNEGKKYLTNAFNEIIESIKDKDKESIGKVLEKLEQIYYGKLPADINIVQYVNVNDHELENRLPNLGIKHLPELWSQQGQNVPDEITNLVENVRNGLYEMMQAPKELEEITKIDKLCDDIEKLSNSLKSVSNHLTSAQQYLDKAHEILSKWNTLPVPPEPKNRPEPSKYWEIYWRKMYHDFFENIDSLKLKKSIASINSFIDSINSNITLLKGVVCDEMQLEPSEGVRKIMFGLVFAGASAMPGITHVRYGTTSVTMGFRMYIGWNPMPGVVAGIIDLTKLYFDTAKALVLTTTNKVESAFVKISEKLKNLFNQYNYKNLNYKNLIAKLYQLTILSLINQIAGELSNFIFKLANIVVEVLNKMIIQLIDDILKNFVEKLLVKFIEFILGYILKTIPNEILNILNRITEKLGPLISFLTGKFLNKIFSFLNEKFLEDILQQISEIKGKMQNIVKELLSNIVSNILESIVNQIRVDDSILTVDINQILRKLQGRLQEILSDLKKAVGQAAVAALLLINKAERRMISWLIYLRELTTSLSNVIRLPLYGRGSMYVLRIESLILKSGETVIEKLVTDKKGYFVAKDKDIQVALRYYDIAWLPGMYSEVLVSVWGNLNGMPVPIDYSLVPVVGDDIEKLRVLVGAYPTSVIHLEINKVGPVWFKQGEKAVWQVVNLASEDLTPVSAVHFGENPEKRGTDGCVLRSMSVKGGETDGSATLVPRIYVPIRDVLERSAVICPAGGAG